MRRASLILVLSLLLGGCGGARDPKTTLQLRDAATGEIRWSVSLAPEANATEPVLAGDVVIVADPGGDAVAYAAADGAERWRASGALPEAAGPAVVVFDHDDRVEARRTQDGRLLWSHQGGESVVRSREGGPLVTITDPDAPGGPATVTLLDALTGRALWSTRVAEGGSAFSAAINADAVAFELHGHEGAVALSIADGRRLWDLRADYVGAITAGEHSIAVTTGLDKTRYQVWDSSTGRKTWSGAASTGWFAGEEPYIGVSGGRAFLRDERTGHELPGRVAVAYGVARHGDLLVGESGRDLTAVKAGRQVWTGQLAQGKRPITYVDADDRFVACVTATGQANEGD